MNEKLEVRLRLYGHLRQEIIRSIELQHKIFFTESLFIGILASLAVSFSTNNLLTGSLYNLYNQLILGMPIVIIAFSFMWLTEQSRLMRAGDYLQFLEYKINAELKEACITWENWLRRSGISMWDVHRIHHISQYFIMGFFLLIAIISIGIMWILNLILYLKIILTSIYIILIFTLIVLMSKVIVHRTSAGEGIKAYYNWEKEFWNFYVLEFL